MNSNESKVEIIRSQLSAARAARDKGGSGSRHAAADVERLLRDLVAAIAEENHARSRNVGSIDQRIRRR